jgi:hypothetical protein
VFCDLVGSTALASRLDAEDWRSLVNAYLDEASATRLCAETGDDTNGFILLPGAAPRARDLARSPLAPPAGDAPSTARASPLRQRFDVRRAEETIQREQQFVGRFRVSVVEAVEVAQRPLADAAAAMEVNSWLGRAAPPIIENRRRVLAINHRLTKKSSHSELSWRRNSLHALGAGNSNSLPTPPAIRQHRRTIA